MTHENMFNNARANFIDYINKFNNSDIVLVKKLENEYDDEIFFNRKKWYDMNLCVVCNSDKIFIYMLAEWSNLQHDA